jgi:hypothetical protein
MIHVRATRAIPPDRDVFQCHLPTGTCTEEGPHAGNKALGTIESGRAMTDLTNNWTEFQFVPDDLTELVFPVRRSYSAAREDARLYAQGRDR